MRHLGLGNAAREAASASVLELCNCDLLEPADKVAYVIISVDGRSRVSLGK
jgi:hypothetical protein